MISHAAWVFVAWVVKASPRGHNLECNFFVDWSSIIYLRQRAVVRFQEQMWRRECCVLHNKCLLTILRAPVCVHVQQGLCL